MKENKKIKFKKNIIISLIVSLAVLAVMGILLLWRYDFEMYDIPTFLSDMFTMGGLTYIVIYLIVLLSRTTFFARFGYLAQKRSARRHKAAPRYKNLQEYMEAREDINFDTRYLWIPGVTFFVIAAIMVLYVMLT